MAKWWEYQPWRRKALIAITWTLFGSSLAMAAAFSAYRHSKEEAKFSPPMRFGEFTVRIPVGWSPNVRTNTAKNLEAVEPTTLSRLNRPRRLLFMQRMLPAGTTLEKFVEQEPALLTRSFIQQEDLADPEPITIAGYPGIAYTKVSAPIFMSTKVYEYVAVVITPQGQGFAVKLYCAGEPSDDDFPLLEGVLDRIEFKQ